MVGFISHPSNLYLILYYSECFFNCALFRPLLPSKSLGQQIAAQLSSELYLPCCCTVFSVSAPLNGGVDNFFLSRFWIGKEVMAMLRLRAGDEKTNVRKSALQVQSFLCASLFSVITQNAVKINNWAEVL